MTTSTKHVLFALSFTALLGSCSRPTATFQPAHAQRYYSPQAQAAPVATAEEAIATATPEAVVAPVATTPVATKADIENVLVKAEAIASTKATAAESRKLSNRISKIREVLAKAPVATSTASTTTKKTTLVQRMMLKHMDKKMQKQLAPEKPMAASTLTAGIIVALIGLLLLLLGTGTGATIGLIALVVGIVLIILGLL